MSTINIKPFLWGPKIWGTIFSIVTIYPDEPSADYMNATIDLFKSFEYLIPCNQCRLSYIDFLKEDDTNILNNNNFKTRQNFINFVYNLREKVNIKLGLTYYIDINYFTKKINNMKCNGAVNEIDYILNTVSEAPFIPIELEDKIYNFIKKKYDYKFTIKLLKKLKKFIKNPIFDINDKLFKLWTKRNKVCRIIIDNIYFNISAGDYTKLDSFTRDRELHIKLFYLGCSIISKIDLERLL
jgi:hypothetical protein